MTLRSARDRTDDYRDAVRLACDRAGLPEAQRRAISGQLVLRPVRGQSADPFTRAAAAIRSGIAEVQRTVTDRRREYLDPARMDDEERDGLEQEVALLLKACWEQIDVLKNAVAPEGKGAEQRRAHQHGVVLALSEGLKAAAARFDFLRGARFERSLGAHRRRLRAAGEAQEAAAATTAGREHAAQQQQQQQMMVQTHDDAQLLAMELSAVVDQVRQAESRMLEVSALSSAFGAHVAQQAAQIEQLYTQAVEASVNFEKGNVELVKTIDRSGGARLYVALIFIVASLMLLFLDWQAG